MTHFQKLSIAIILGAVFGLAAFLPIVTEAHTYLSEQPETCINCHIMRPFYISQQRSSHRTVSCPECHIPHENMAKYFANKSRDGMWDAYVYTTFQDEYAIKLHESSKKTIRDNCLRCHERVMSEISLFDKSERFCGECHREVVHSKQRGAGSFTYSHYPKFKSFTDKLTKKR